MSEWGKYKSILFVFLLGVCACMIHRIFFYVSSLKAGDMLRYFSLILFLAGLYTLLFGKFGTEYNNTIYYVGGPISFTLAYVLWAVGTSKMIRGEQENTNLDYLNRNRLAERVAFIIKNATDIDGLRIGINGKWGEGKTFVMNLVRISLAKENYPIVWFNPWSYQNKDELWIGFRKSFEEGLIAYSKGVFLPSFSRTVRTVFLKILSSKAPKLVIGEYIDELIKADGKFGREEVKTRIEQQIERYLGKNNRIIVFIDDLDRVQDSKVILDLLMGIKEIVNVRHMVFILALDEETILRIIDREFPTQSGRGFLDKIIDYMVTLPTPEDDQICSRSISLSGKQSGFIIFIVREISARLSYSRCM